MTVEYNVLAPGPVNLHPRVRETLALPMIHHRTPEFDQILKRVLSQLKLIFQTEQPCYILTSTGSGGMEALLINVLNAGDTVLGIDSGKFGERWCEMAEVYGAKLIRHKVSWGEAVAVSDIEALLKKHPEIKIVLTQACETSSGVVHPIKELGELIHKYPNTLFLVDGITALGAMPLPMDAWHIDGLVGGSQKAFMLPTGLSLLSFSKKAWAQIEKSKTPRFYFDIRKEKAANDKGETFFSSNVTLIRALDVVSELILEKGLDAFFKTIADRANLTRKYAQKLGYELYAKKPSASLTAIKVPDGQDSQKMRGLIESKHHITIMGGQDQAKGKILRIGHMGYITDQQNYELFKALAEIATWMPADKSQAVLAELKKELGL